MKWLKLHLQISRLKKELEESDKERRSWRTSAVYWHREFRTNREANREKSSE